MSETDPPPVAPVDTTSQRFKDAVSAYLAAMHGAQGEIIPPLYYAIKAWERDKPASGELERLRAALKAAEIEREYWRGCAVLAKDHVGELQKQLQDWINEGEIMQGKNNVGT